ncbi:hypothetical protein EX30DRAFT_389293 [Ascodesmis nigricans]|uniref:Uncharacterized protein n=1 Tax=Ascodesmis nigricans TaxID=341454 RepID=A0A4S2MIS3_9PEZI|nr:hypothetical protein EX30DRAFT_389293 [Ascodesmis nigricans]
MTSSWCTLCATPSTRCALRSSAARREKMRPHHSLSHRMLLRTEDPRASTPRPVVVMTLLFLSTGGPGSFYPHRISMVRQLVTCQPVSPVPSGSVTSLHSFAPFQPLSADVSQQSRQQAELSFLIQQIPLSPHTRTPVQSAPNFMYGGDAAGDDELAIRGVMIGCVLVRLQGSAVSMYIKNANGIENST